MESLLPPSVHHVLRTKPLWLFVGSGISLFAPTSLPTWWSFVMGALEAVVNAAGPDAAAVGAALKTALGDKRLAAYEVTSVFAKRLGSVYLELMRCFEGAIPNAAHTALARSLLTGEVAGIATTNFDACLEDAVLAAGGDVVTLTGVWEEDRQQLEAQWQRHLHRQTAATASAAATQPVPLPVVVAPSFAAMQSLNHTMQLVTRGSHAFILKIHGTASLPASCIDTEQQRVQGLPSSVVNLLGSWMHAGPLMFLAFGGGDLDRDIDYLSLKREGDQAHVLWLLRESEPEPAGLFARMRGALGDRFIPLRGDLQAGRIEGVNATFTAKLQAWAEHSVGRVWCSAVLADLWTAAKLPADDPTILRLLAPAPSPATDSSVSVSSSASVRARTFEDVLTSLQHDATVVTPSAQQQLSIAAPLRRAMAALAGGDPWTGLRHAHAAVKMQRQHYSDSRLLPDAWKPLSVFAACLHRTGQVAAARTFLSSAQAVAEIAGNLHAQQVLARVVGGSSASGGSAPAASSVVPPGSTLLPVRVGSSASSGGSSGSHHGSAPSSSPSASPPAFASVAIPPLDSLVIEDADDDATLVFLPALDNVADFAQQGVPIATLLRAHLHRAMLVGDRLALPPQFLLNCRPFVTDVLFQGGVMRVEYLKHISPLLPARQTVDQGEGVGKVAVDICGSPTPLATFREQCQVRNAVFLAERVPDALIAALDVFYARFPALLRFYELDKIAGGYGTRTAALLQRQEALQLQFESPVDKAALSVCLPPTLQFVRACMRTTGLTRSLVYRWASLFRYPVTDEDFRHTCATQLRSELPAEAAALAAARSELAARPWLYADVLHSLGDSAYVTNLPLNLGLSLVSDEQEEKLVSVVSVALAHEPAAATILPCVKPHGASTAAAELRVVELARLPVAHLESLRQHPAAAAFRHAVRRLRRAMQRQGPKKEETAPCPASEPPSPTSACVLPALLARANSALPSSAGPTSVLIPTRTASEGTAVATPTSSHVAYDRLYSKVCEAAATLLTVVRDALVPVDAVPFPLLSLDTSESASTAATSDSTELDVTALLNSMTEGLVVCKGAPIPPNFSIPCLRFPGLMPVTVPPQAASWHSTTSGAGGGAGAMPSASRRNSLSSPGPMIQCLEPIVAYSEPANKWVSLRFDRVLFPSGKEGRYNIVKEGFDAGVCVLPIRADGQIVLLKQHRYPLGCFTLEVPRGGGVHGKKPWQQALAELEEETGLTVPADGGASASKPSKLVPLAGPVDSDNGGVFWPNSGISDTRVHFFAAIDVVPNTRPDAPGPEDTEAIDCVRAFTPQQVYDMVRDGDIGDQFTCTALALGMLAGLLPPPHA